VANWKQPLKWNRLGLVNGHRRRVFCASLADVFDNQVPNVWRSDLFELIEMTPNLDWLLLTKRPQNIEKMIWPKWDAGLPENIWLGTTCENQEEADRRIPHLLAAPVSVRFVSYEPALGPVNFAPWIGWKCCVTGARVGTDFTCGDCDPCIGAFGKTFLDWIICGGESGSGARPLHPEWLRSLRDQCAAADVPFFFKQWGEWSLVAVEGFGGNERKPSQVLREPYATEMIRVGKKAAGRLLDGVEHNGFPGAIS
jgi:protein gp37